MLSLFLLTLPAVAESKALALEGGGFRAQAVDAGFVSGLLSFAAKQTGSKATLVDTGLLADFEHFSSNSGSSWFFSSLAYSQSYRELIEAMAAEPATAAAQHNAGYTEPLLKATNVDPEKFSLREELARKIVASIFGEGDEDLLFLVQYFLSTEATWNSFAEVLLNSTAALGPEKRMGSSVNAFASGKTWLVANSLLLPSDKEVRLFQDVHDKPRVSYEASSGLPEMLPAKFSVVLGAGETSSAPHDYLPESAFEGVELSYKAVIHWYSKPHATSAVLDSRDFAGGSLTSGVGQLPVNRVVSTSSACAGVAPVLGLLVDEGLAIFDADLTPWISNAPGGDAFTTANNLVQGLSKVDRATVDSLATAQVHGLIDGGYTDGTGLAQAVAAGADEVLVLLNSNASNTAFYVEMLFEDGPEPVNPGSSSAIFPVFESPIGQQVAENFRGFHRLSLPATEYLKQLAVGSFKATTASNRFFGIDAGREVTLNVVNLCSDLGIVAGGKANFGAFDTLVQEVILALNDERNADFVSRTLLPMVLGSTQLVV